MHQQQQEHSQQRPGPLAAPLSHTQGASLYTVSSTWTLAALAKLFTRTGGHHRACSICPHLSEVPDLRVPEVQEQTHHGAHELLQTVNASAEILDSGTPLGMQASLDAVRLQHVRQVQASQGTVLQQARQAGATLQPGCGRYRRAHGP